MLIYLIKTVFGSTDDTGHVTITPTKPIPEGNVTAKATDHAEHPNSSTSQPKTLITPVNLLCWNWESNKDPVEVVPIQIQSGIIDKDGVSVRYDNTCHDYTTKPIPGNVTVR